MSLCRCVDVYSDRLLSFLKEVFPFLYQCPGVAGSSILNTIQKNRCTNKLSQGSPLRHVQNVQQKQTLPLLFLRCGSHGEKSFIVIKL